jgi:hypothetical protein
MCHGATVYNVCGLRGIGAAEAAAVIGHERRETTR